MVRIKLEIEKNTLFGRAFVRVRAKITKNTLVARLRLGLGLKKRISSFLVGLWLG